MVVEVVVVEVMTILGRLKMRIDLMFRAARGGRVFTILLTRGEAMTLISRGGKVGAVEMAALGGCDREHSSSKSEKRREHQELRAGSRAGKGGKAMTIARASSTKSSQANLEGHCYCDMHVGMSTGIMHHTRIELGLSAPQAQPWFSCTLF